MTLGVVGVVPVNISVAKNEVYIFKINDKIVENIGESCIAKFKRWIGK